MLIRRGEAGKRVQLLRVTATTLVVGLAFSTLVAAIGNPSCDHHAGHADVSTGSTHHAAAHAAMDHESGPGNEHENRPCNCPSHCQQAGTVEAAGPIEGHVAIADTHPVSLQPTHASTPVTAFRRFLHPFANAPPIA